MSRPLSERARRAINAQETEEVFLLLLTIDHSSLAEPLRFVNNTTDIVSRGHKFYHYPFNMDLPLDSDEELPRVSIDIDNVDREIVLTLRQLEGRPTVTCEVVLASQPSVVEAGPFEFELVDAPWNHVKVTGNLSFEPILDEPFPADSFTPNLFPGLF